MLDRDQLPVPEHGLALSCFLTVRDVGVSRQFYADICRGPVVLEEKPDIGRIANGWIITNPDGGPTPDDPVSAFLTVGVADDPGVHRFSHDRMGATVTEIEGSSHAVMTSHADRVAQVVLAAAQMPATQPHGRISS